MRSGTAIYDTELVSDVAAEWLAHRNEMKQIELAEHLGISLRRCQRLIARAVDLGIIAPGLAWRRRVSKETEQNLCDAYERREAGYTELAKRFGVAKTTAWRILTRNGIRLRTEDRPLRSDKPRKNSRHKSQEFSARTKHKRFTDERGLCQECGMPIIGGWRSASYHHIVMVRFGGTASADNCMVLHTRCHRDPEISKRLHGFRGYGYKKEAII